MLANLVSPANPDTKTFDELVLALSKHFQPKSSIISERYSFLCRCQEPDESLTDFVASLTKLIVRCDYDANFQATLLRDRFVCGLFNESTRKRLLTEEDSLTLERALEIATSVKKGTLHAKQMKHETRPSGVHHVSHNTGKTHQSSTRSFTSTPVCHRCGGPNLAPSCRFIHDKCRSCGKTGHIAKVCRSKPQATSSTNTQQHYSSTKKTMKSHSASNRTNTLDIDTPDVQESYSMFTVTTRSRPIMVSVQLNEQKLDMEVDTGAAISVISEETF